MKRLAATLAFAALALAVAACGSSGPSTPAPSLDPSSPTVVADKMAFEGDLTLAAGQATKVTFINKEGAPHNITIARDESFSDKVFEGEIISSSTVVYDIPALEPGSYVFRCDLHPDMLGQVVAR